MIIVSDTSPISALLKCNQIHLLHSLYSTIIIPTKVFDELLVLEKAGVNVRGDLKKSWVKILAPKDEIRVKSFYNLVDEGEAEAIVLALELHAELLLMDDLAGRELAKENGLATKGLLGILVEAEKKKLLPDAKRLADELRDNGIIWVSERVYEVFLNALKNIRR
ncbi:MAG: hypothetical protein KIS94_15055 [Chitinophagales bacterium]|nr:hypothetical protein [Chitinophagales bacterium]